MIAPAHPDVDVDGLVEELLKLCPRAEVSVDRWPDGGVKRIELYLPEASSDEGTTPAVDHRPLKEPPITAGAALIVAETKGEDKVGFQKKTLELFGAVNSILAEYEGPLTLRQVFYRLVAAH